MLFLLLLAAPLVPSGPDPFIAVHDGHYYLTYTTGRDIRVRKAATLESLSSAEAVRVWSDPDPERCCNIWAPEIHRLNGPAGPRWYIYYTAGPRPCCALQRMHVLESEADNPLGPYRYKARLFDQTHDFWAIDPTVFELSGRLYAVYSGTPQDRMPHEKPQHLYIVPLSNPWTVAAPRIELSAPTLSWETRGGGVNEGAAFLRHGERLFLFYSGSGCYTDDYAIGYLEASAKADPLDPASWIKHPRPFLARDDSAARVAPGHNSFFRPPGSTEDWILYHATPRPGLGCGAARAPHAQPLGWTPDGRPTFIN